MSAEHKQRRRSSISQVMQVLASPVTETVKAAKNTVSKTKEKMERRRSGVAERRGSAGAGKRSILSRRGSTNDPTEPADLKVRFSNRRTVRKITSVNNMSEKEICATWYTVEERQEVSSENNLTIYKMEEGQETESDDTTSRGLETSTEEGKWNQYKAARDASNIVLDEQDRLMKEKIVDPEQIAQLYRAETVTSRNEALFRGLEDAKVAKKFLGNGLTAELMKSISKSTKESKRKKKVKSRRQKTSTLQSGEVKVR